MKIVFLYAYVLFEALFSNLAKATSTNGSLYSRTNGLDGWIFTDFLLTESERLSPAQCSYECVNLNTCMLFFVHNTTGRCRYHSQMYDNTWSGTSSIGWMAYSVHIERSYGTPSSCAEVFSNGFYLDGEYLIYPFPGTPTLGVSVYCHDLFGSAKEYISLKHENVFQKKENIGCDAETNMETTFSKIGFDFSTMYVARGDFTFASIVGNGVPYGSSEDCTAWEEIDCRRAKMYLDLRGTGFAIKADIVWADYGYKTSMSVSRSADDKVVNITCRGYCVECVPSNYFLELVYTGDDVG